MKIIYINSFSTKNHHEEVNSALVIMLSYIYKDIKCYTTSSSLEFLKKNLHTRINIKYKPIFSISGSSRISELLRYFFSSIWNLVILFTSDREDLLFYNFNNVFSSKLINYFSGLLNRKVVVVMHGELEYILQDYQNKSFINRLFIFLTKNYISATSKFYVKHIVLGDCIKNNLEKLNVSQTFINSIFSIDHPCLNTNRNWIDKDNNKNKINLGTIGSLNRYKGLERYLQLVSRCTNPKITFSVVGRIFGDLKRFKELRITTPINSNKSLSKDEFSLKVKELDYLLFFYNSNSYKLTASGALIDSIKYQIPFISLSNDYFDYMQQKYGPFGHIFEDLTSMESFINDNDFIKGKKKYDFDRIATQLSPQILYLQLQKYLSLESFI